MQQDGIRRIRGWFEHLLLQLSYVLQLFHLFSFRTLFRQQSGTQIATAKLEKAIADYKDALTSLDTRKQAMLEAKTGFAAHLDALADQYLTGRAALHMGSVDETEYQMWKEELVSDDDINANPHTNLEMAQQRVFLADIKHRYLQERLKRAEDAVMVERAEKLA